jgi:DHA2 family multidrug resistance protein
MSSWFKDRLGSRRLYLLSLILFTAGSLMCGMAWNLSALISARVLQALGGGFITPIGMSMVSEVFPPKERGRALGLWGMGVIAGPAVGPTLGGYITKTLGWRYIFLVNLPIGVLTVVAAAALLRRDVPRREDSKPFDGWGFLFLATFLVAFLLGLSQGEKEGWESRYIITCWILAALGLAFFFVVEADQENGIVDLSLFRSRVYTACILVTFGRTVALFAATFLLPLFVQNLMGRDELQCGLMMLPGALTLAVFLPLFGRMSDSMGPRWMVLAGALGLVLFMYQYRLLDNQSPTWAVIWPTLVRGAAIALMVAPILAAALNSVPTRKAAQASSVMNLVQQISGSIGITVLATYLDHRRSYHFAELTERMRLLRSDTAAQMAPMAQRALGLGYTRGESMGVASGMLLRRLGQAAAVRAFDDAFLFGTVIICLACVPVFLLPTKNVLHIGVDAEAMVME